MKVLTRRILPLVLLLTQAATTFASPAFTLCISPKGHVCIDTPWNECTCCRDEEPADPAPSPGRGISPSSKAPNQSGGCRCSHCRAKAAAATGLPSDQAPGTWNGKPCRCKHIPLFVAQDADDVSTARVPAVDRSLSIHDFMPSDCGPAVHAEVNVLPFCQMAHPPPSHLQVVACTVLRC